MRALKSSCNLSLQPKKYFRINMKTWLLKSFQNPGYFLEESSPKLFFASSNHFWSRQSSEVSTPNSSWAKSNVIAIVCRLIDSSKLNWVSQNTITIQCYLNLSKIKMYYIYLLKGKMIKRLWVYSSLLLIRYMFYIMVHTWGCSTYNINLTVTSVWKEFK